MNALPSSLHPVRVTVQPKCKVPLWSPGSQRNDDIKGFLTPLHGPTPCILTDDDWMLVQLPDLGLVGLPLCGESHSWEDAFGNNRIEIQAHNSEDNIEDWDDVLEFLTRT